MENAAHQRVIAVSVLLLVCAKKLKLKRECGKFYFQFRSALHKLKFIIWIKAMESCEGPKKALPGLPTKMGVGGWDFSVSRSSIPQEKNCLCQENHMVLNNI